MKTVNINPAEMPVMKSNCKTCPFKITENGRLLNQELASIVIENTLFQGHQICHGTEGHKRKPQNRCVGSYNYNLEIYARMGLSHLVK